MPPQALTSPAGLRFASAGSGALIPRRSLLSGAGSLTLAALAITGCAAPARGSTLVSCISDDPPSLNPAMSSDSHAGQAGAPVYSWLLEIERDGSHRPDLAETCQVSPDAKTYVFRLREGVVWHDGRPCTSADVKFTVTQMLARLHPLARNAYVNLEALETPDDHTVIMRFSQSNRTLLSLPSALGPILPRHLWEGTDFATNPLNKAPVGTGPFRFVEYRIGESIRYAKNPAYHFAGQPAFDGLIFSIVPDPVSRSAAFENGEIDCLLATDVPPNDVPRLRARPEVGAMVSSYSGGVWLCMFNTRRPAISDKRVRQALTHAIDRTYIRDVIGPGVAQKVLGPLWPGSPLYNHALEDYAFNPAAAAAMLDEAGFRRRPDGTRFSLKLVWSGSSSIVTRMAQVMAQNLKDVGVRLVLSPVEGQALVQHFINRDFDMIIQGYGLGPDPDLAVERLYNSNNIKAAPGVNNANYVNRTVDRLFAEQRLASVPAQRKAIYDRIQELIWDDIPIIPVFAFDTVGLFDTRRVSGIYNVWSSVAETFARARPA